MTSFDYTSMPINVAKHEIRLIEILPSDRNLESTAPATHSATQTDRQPPSQVRVRMKRVCLDDGPVFTALSYTWGDVVDRRPILLDDMEVCIGANLEDALSIFVTSLQRPRCGLMLYVSISLTAKRSLKLSCRWTGSIKKRITL